MKQTYLEDMLEDVWHELQPAPYTVRGASLKLLAAMEHVKVARYLVRDAARIEAQYGLGSLFDQEGER